MRISSWHGRRPLLGPSRRRQLGVRHPRLWGSTGAVSRRKFRESGLVEDSGLEELDIIVVGGGIIGVAVARALAHAGRQAVLLEAEASLGMHASSRNSEVIHAGLYYPSGSLKARLCVRGRAQLYSYCAAQDVWHQKLGKVVVATSERQLPLLEQLQQRAADNGVTEVSWLTQNEVRELEPEVVALAGLWSPMTGIVDSHTLLARLKAEALAAGATVVASSQVLSGTLGGRGWQVQIGGQEPFEVSCRVIVNAAGVCAQTFARKLLGLPPETIPPAYIAKGQYYQLTGPSPFRHLVYPLPDAGGLGVHVTLDASGRARFGPDVDWVDSMDYSFDGRRLQNFIEAIRRYYPTLDARRLCPGYAGLRAKVVGPGEPPGDFTIQGPAELGLPIVNLYGIESPGLTASLAIADHVVAQLSS